VNKFYAWILGVNTLLIWMLVYIDIVNNRMGVHPYPWIDTVTQCMNTVR